MSARAHTGDRTVYEVNDGFSAITVFPSEAMAELFAERAEEIVYDTYDVIERPASGHTPTGEFGVFVEGRVEHAFGTRDLAEACAAAYRDHMMQAARVCRTGDA